MDAALWPALFAAVGSPAQLTRGLLAAGRPVSAACCLLIVEHVEGTAIAQELSLLTIQVTLLWEFPPRESNPIKSQKKIWRLLEQHAKHSNHIA
jgi:hypothetical protein